MRLPNETDKAWTAFQDFLALGSARSLAALHRQYTDKKREKEIVPTRSQKTILGWSSQFNWFERAKQWDAEEEERRREHLKEKEREAWEQSVEDFRKQSEQISAATTRSVILLLSKANEALTYNPALDPKGKNKPLLSVDQAIRALSAVPKAGEFAQSTQATALGVAQLLQELEGK